MRPKAKKKAAPKRRKKEGDASRIPGHPVKHKGAATSKPEAAPPEPVPASNGKSATVEPFTVLSGGGDLLTGHSFSDGENCTAALLNQAVNEAVVQPGFITGKPTSIPQAVDQIAYLQNSSGELRSCQLSQISFLGLGAPEAHNTFLAGPPAGAAAAPGFRVILPADIALPPDVLTTTTLDASNANVFFRVLTANTTFTIANMLDGQQILVMVQQAASGGPYTAAFAGIFWEAGTPPAMTTTAGHKNIYIFVKIGGVGYGRASQNYS